MDFWDHHNLARATLYLGRVEEAERLIRSLPARGAHEAAVGVLEASLCERKGDNDAAVAAWTKARQAGASAYWCRFGEGRALARIGRFSDAQRALAAALAESDAEEGGLRFALSVDLRLLDFRSAEAKFQRLEATLDEREWALLESLPGMTYPQERTAALSATRHMTGAGQVVDLGCFLGSLTAALALGLSKNERALAQGIRVHAFDNFLWWPPMMDQFWRENFPGDKPLEDQSFEHVFEHVTASWKPLIEVHPGDLLVQHWSEPIEVLSIDAMKSPSLARHVIAEFMPHLIEGAYVFHQDYCFDMTWWIHVYHYVLRDHFEMVDDLPGASGMMFRVVSPITMDDVRRALAHDLSDTGVADEAFARSLELASPIDRPAVAAAHVRYYAEIDSGVHLARSEALRARYAQDLRQ